MGKFPITEKSTLIIEHRFNETLEHLRQRAEATGYDIGWDGLCEECDARFTETDIEMGACTQCGCVIPGLRDVTDAQKE